MQQVSSSGYIDAAAVRLDDTSKSFSGDIVAFDQDVTVSTVPLYYIVRADVAGGATEGTFDISLQVYTTADTTNNPLAFTNATEVVAPPSGSPAGLTATAAGNLLQVSLSWGSATGADSYSIFRATYSGVTTSDFFLGVTNGTSFNDDYIPPAQQMYYKVVGTNRAGASGASSAANATSVDVTALTTSNIYLRAGLPGGIGAENMPQQQLLGPWDTFVDNAGNIYVADASQNRVRFVPKASGTYFGQAMTANAIYTIAGNGNYSYAGDGGIATAGKIKSPSGVTVDSDGNVYIADTGNHRIRFVPKTSGTFFGQAMTANYIYTIAGNGTGGYVADDVAATSTQIKTPYGLSVDIAGNLYVADYGNHRVRFVPKTSGTFFGQAMTANYIYTIAGNGTGGYVSDDVAATATQIYNPYGVSLDAAGNIYVADSGNHRIRFIPKLSGTNFGQSMTANSIYTIAGNGTAGYQADNVAAASTRINAPRNVRVDVNGHIYIADTGNQRVRMIPKASGTFFGQAMTANYIYTIAGNGTGGYLADSVAATSTRLYDPSGVSVDGAGNLYIANYTNNAVRFVPKSNGTYFGQAMTANYIYRIAGFRYGYSGEGGIATATMYYGMNGVSVDSSGNMFIVDTSNFRIRFVPKTSGTFYGQSMVANSVYTIAGTGSFAFNNDGGVATTAGLKNPNSVYVNSSGNIYIADSSNQRIRFIPKTDGTYFGQSWTANHMYTLTGDGTATYGGDGGPAVSGQVSPRHVSTDRDGNVYIADTGNHRIRFIPLTDGTYFGVSMTANYIYTIAGNGTGGYVADNVAATSTQINAAWGVNVDYDGNIYISDTDNHRIRFVPKSSGTYFGQSMTANYIYTIVGNGTAGYVSDNLAATATRISYPRRTSIDSGGNVYVSDYSNNRIRFVPKRSGTYFGQSMTANYIYTIGGNSLTGYNGENAAATGKGIYLPTDVHVSEDHKVYMVDYNEKARMIAGEDFIAPSTATLTAVPGSTAGTIDVSWSSAGDDMVNLGNLTGDYRIQYATYTVAWSTGSTPADATTVTLSTTNATPGSAQSYVATGLTAGLTYYFALFTGDEVPNWSDVSNTASAWLDGTPPSTSTLNTVTGDVDGEIDLTWSSAGDNGESGNLTGTYRIQYATYTVAWSTSSTPTDATTVTISTTNVVPGSAEAYTATGLTAGLTYYFVLWTGDEVPNWSEVSNTALVYLPVPVMVTLAEAVGQPGWIGQGRRNGFWGQRRWCRIRRAGWWYRRWR
ncbi:MAG: hypothetical protein IPN19_08460 [Elusimicrobia bacterium]|nr:hypothetical protein [Elusimicrobiota bacterium]